MLLQVLVQVAELRVFDDDEDGVVLEAAAQHADDVCVVDLGKDLHLSTEVLPGAPGSARRELLYGHQPAATAAREVALPCDLAQFHLQGDRISWARENGAAADSPRRIARNPSGREPAVGRI